jgi:phosphohistidine phosphatase
LKKHTKLLLILRHAKSSWEFAELSDHDRPLNNRGKRDALRIGKKLLKEGVVPQLIISSSAIRASSTALKVAKACGYQGEIIVENSLYGSGYTEYLNAVKKKDDRYDIIMLVGHNPHSEQLLEILTGTMNTMSTCTVASVRLSIASWNEIDSQVRGELLNLWQPKELSSND